MSQGLAMTRERPTRSGFDSALDALYRDYGPELRAYVRGKLGDASEAEELVQEAFLRLQKSQTGTQIEDPRNFVFRIAANLVTDRLRARGAQRRLQGSLEGSGAEQGVPGSRGLAITPETRLSDRQDLDVILRAVADLPPMARQVFLLRRVRHMSYAEIAKKLGISSKTVDAHLRRAVKSVSRRLIEDQGGRHD